MPETIVQKQVRLVLEQQCREIADTIAQACPAGVGFALLLFDYGDGGNIAYVSNGARDDMRKALRELLDRWEVQRGS